MRKRGGRLLAFVLAAVVLVAGGYARPALAEQSVPTLLVVDANLGDFESCAGVWLGDSIEEVAQTDGYALLSAADPAWWSAAGGTPAAPSTFVLGVADGTQPFTVERLVWALDQIRAAGAEPRTFVLATGPAGLVVREYAEDLASVRQSDRADIVGLGFCGTPHNGYTAGQSYPESKLWAALSDATDYTLDDLLPGSARLAELNAAPLPNVAKVLSIEGTVGDMGFGICDGAAIATDCLLPPDVSDQVINTEVDATLSQQVNLTGLWTPLTSKIDFGSRALDAKLVERLSAMTSYANSAEVQDVVRSFYDSWYAGGAPVTHTSDVLALDLSGSMREEIQADVPKIDAAKKAAHEYLTVTGARAKLPLSAPADLSVLGFAESVSQVARGFDTAALGKVDALAAAYQETDMGQVLDAALQTLSSSPTAGSRHVLLLSDGASTQGQTNEQMLAGAVRAAKEQGIVIDTVGFGNVGESNEGFLKQVSAATGGTYYAASNTYELRANFMRSAYGSMGLEVAEEELAADKDSTATLLTADAGTEALLATVVFEGAASDVALLCDGVALEPGQYEVSGDSGLVNIQCVDPLPGEYGLETTESHDRRLVLAVRQQGISHDIVGTRAGTDWSLILLVVAGIVLVAGIAVTVAVSLRRRVA